MRVLSWQGETLILLPFPSRVIPPPLTQTAAVDGLFIDANTCDVHVVPGLDYETSTSLTGTITVQDKSGLTDVVAFTFAVSDANDNTPVSSRQNKEYYRVSLQGG